jgi:metal-dependent amidase/aminoacylase/carboxypeptidase family protein
MKNNMTLAQLYIDNMKTVGRTARLPRAGGPTGSTDMGNVSQVVPSIHPMVKIAADNVPIHSPEFADAAASEEGISGMVDAAKCIAMMIVDLLGKSDVLRRVREEFERGS